MPNSHVLTLFIWLVSILTLSISDEIKTDGGTSLKSTLNESFADGSSKTEHQTSPSLIQLTSGNVNSTETLNKNVATPSVAGEGGPISIPTTRQTSSTTSHLTPDIQANLSNEEEIIPYVKRRKNTSKIVSRKGANEMPALKSENISSAETASSDDAKSIADASTTANVSQTIKKVDPDADKLNSNEKRTDASSNVTVNSISRAANVTQEKTSTNAAAVQEHKPKPTATVIGPNSDKETFIPHIKGSRLGMPKKIDYVLPVIVTLVALPVLGAIIFMVYKQGRDCWDKRHYRRMDFLIDGMYND